MSLPRVELWGFDVSQAELIEGKRFERRFTDADGHEHVVTLSWNHGLGCPHVATYRADLMLRITEGR